MPTAKRKLGNARPGAEYRGKQTRTGNSLGFRFDAALFKSHPEFAGEVHAHVIAPGRMLVSLSKAGSKTDPYAVFRAMLHAGNPRGTMKELLAVSAKIAESSI
jgi:hypothetical protein